MIKNRLREDILQLNSNLRNDSNCTKCRTVNCTGNTVIINNKKQKKYIDPKKRKMKSVALFKLLFTVISVSVDTSVSVIRRY